MEAIGPGEEPLRGSEEAETEIVAVPQAPPRQPVGQVLASDGHPPIAVVDLGRDISDALRASWDDGRRFESGGVVESVWLQPLFAAGSTAASSLAAGNVFLATANPKTLMVIGEGVSTAVMGGGRIIGHAPFIAASLFAAVGRAALLLLLAATPVTAQSGGTIRGTVVDAFGTALPGVRVTATGSGVNAEAVTDAEGAYEFAGAAPGDHIVTANLFGYAEREIRVTVRAGAFETVRIIVERLPEAGSEKGPQLGVLAGVHGAISLPASPGASLDLVLDSQAGWAWVSLQFLAQMMRWNVQYDDKTRRDHQYLGRLRLGFGERQGLRIYALFEKGTAVVKTEPAYLRGKTYDLTGFGLGVGLATGRFTTSFEAVLGGSNRSDPDLYGRRSVSLQYRLPSRSDRADDGQLRQALANRRRVRT